MAIITATKASRIAISSIQKFAEKVIIKRVYLFVTD